MKASSICAFGSFCFNRCNTQPMSILPRVEILSDSESLVRGVTDTSGWLSWRTLHQFHLLSCVKKGIRHRRS